MPIHDFSDVVTVGRRFTQKGWQGLVLYLLVKVVSHTTHSTPAVPRRYLAPKTKCIPQLACFRNSRLSGKPHLIRPSSSAAFHGPQTSSYLLSAGPSYRFLVSGHPRRLSLQEWRTASTCCTRSLSTPLSSCNSTGPTVDWILSNEKCMAPRCSRILTSCQNLGKQKRSYNYLDAYHHFHYPSCSLSCQQSMALPSLHSELVCLNNLQEFLQGR